MIQFAKNEKRLEKLEDEIASLVANIDAATYRLLALLHEFDTKGGWGWGFRNCAHWLSWRTGMDMGAAREKMRVAHALSTLPKISDAMRRGTLSYSKARALTRIASPENESELLEIALQGTASQTEQVVRAWQRIDRADDANVERVRHERRELMLYVDHDGSYVIRGRLDPEVGAALERALEKAEETLFARDDDMLIDEPMPCPAQRRADAIGIVAQHSLNPVCDVSNPALSGDTAERFQVVLHVDADALRADGSAGMCHLENGARVSAETSRRIACDATQVVMAHDETGKTIDVGRRTRVIPPALRRALEHRDGGCRFPGCGLKYCDAHHVQHWADGGATSLDNLLLLCRFHHRLLHEEQFTVRMVDEGRNAVFETPYGSEIVLAPRREAVREDVVKLLVAENVQTDEQPIDEVTAPTWNGDKFDLDLAMYLLSFGHDPEDVRRVVELGCVEIDDDDDEIETASP